MTTSLSRSRARSRMGRPLLGAMHRAVSVLRDLNEDLRRILAEAR